MKDFLIIAHCKRSDGIPHWLHAATMEQLLKPCRFAHIYETEAFDIGQSRQTAAEMFLKVPEATLLLFVDDDIAIPKADSLMKMVEVMEAKNISIISGLYVRKDRTGIEKEIPLIMACEDRGGGQLAFGFPFKDKPYPPSTLIKVGAVPAGFLLIKREVLEKTPPPWFVYGSSEFTKKHGEDIYFSMKTRKAGFSLFVDTYVELLHYVPHWAGNPELIRLVLKDSSTLPTQLEEMRKCLSNKTENAHAADA